MGILRRVLSRPHGTPYSAHFFTHIRDDAVTEVVGEFYHQASIRGARPPGPGDLPPGMPPPPAGYYKAMLLPEPTNRYDRNAVAVHLWGGNTWFLAGYIAKLDAPGWQAVFRFLALNSSSAPAIACDAATVNERDITGVVLHLGTPAECIAELVTTDRQPAAHPGVGKRVVFAGAGLTQVAGVVIDRAAQLMLARWAGCEVLPRMSKKTELLIAALPGDPTGNEAKAREYGIPIVSEPDFLMGIGIPRDYVRTDLRWASRQR